MPVSTERLRNYHVGLKGWITNASSCMPYPHSEHTPIPSVPPGIILTPSSDSLRFEFSDCLQQIQAREDIVETGGILSYKCEKKPMINPVLFHEH